jgi:hypothetical protein
MVTVHLSNSYPNVNKAERLTFSLIHMSETRYGYKLLFDCFHCRPVWKLGSSFSVYIILPENTHQYLFTAADNSLWKIFHSRYGSVIISDIMHYKNLFFWTVRRLQMKSPKYCWWLQHTNVIGKHGFILTLHLEINMNNNGEFLRSIRDLTLTNTCVLVILWMICKTNICHAKIPNWLRKLFKYDTAIPQ